MLFNSSEYLIFFLIALTGAWFLRNRISLRALFLLVFSYIFYTTNNHELILLIIASTLIDYYASIFIEDSSKQGIRKLCVITSLAANLGILCFFKYFNFFAGSIAHVFTAFGHQADWVDMNILLPVGISFYTFQSMSYTIDVYRKRIPAERSLIHFACYISFFPQLIAGPIVRANDFIPQTHQKPGIDVDRLETALFKIFSGLMKKIVFADFLAIYADRFFDAPTQVGTVEAWLGLYAFCMQIYFDFSGYTDIALGCALLLGFQLPENFNSPYAATSFSDFWRRWHITLSHWFRDYLYIPLGGNRRHVYLNLFLTMTLCGLWHGAAWTFVAWGILHGVLLCAERMLGWNDISKPSLLRSLIMVQAIALSWIPFRAQGLGDISEILRSLAGANPTPSPVTVGMAAAAMLIVLSIGYQFAASRLQVFDRFMRIPLPIRGMAYAALWAVIIVFNAAGSKEFIYFQF